MKIGKNKGRLNLCTLLLPIVSGLLFVSLSGCDNLVNPSTAGTPTSTPGVAAQSTAASWPDQLHAAQTAMAKVDQNAMLIDIQSSPKGGVNSSWDYDGTFGVAFTYLSASGNRTLVSLEDASPASTVQTIDLPKIPDAPRPQLTPGETQQALAQIAISPRDAGRITWKDGPTQTLLHGAKVRPLIGVDLSHKPIAWFVQYEPNPEVFTGIQTPVTVYVDAQTGEIIPRSGGAPSP